MSTPTISTDQWLAAAKYRRSVYGLKASSPVPDSRIEQIINEVQSFSPSSYNTQPGRLTLVLGDKHRDLWDIVVKEAEPILRGVSEDVWGAMAPRFEAFKNAYGSVLFWVSGQAVKESGEKHQSAAHMFPVWAEHASAMTQLLVWTALELEGFGANLQHMAAIPPVEAALRAFCQVPDHYTLAANMNFGEEAQPHPDVPGKLPFGETLNIVK